MQIISGSRHTLPTQICRSAVGQSAMHVRKIFGLALSLSLNVKIRKNIMDT